MPGVSPWLLALAAAALSAALFWAYGAFIGPRMYQAFREDGPEHHLQKGRVPTGAGIILVLLLLVAVVLYFLLGGANSPSGMIGVYVCIAAALMGLLGFIDDRTKATKGSGGLKARYKLPVMVLAGAGLLYFISQHFAFQLSGNAAVPMEQPWPALVSPVLYYVVGLFVWLGAINGANFTDGLDGLLSMTTLVVLAGTFVALLDGVEALALPAAVGFGCLLAFLAFNWKPAKLYMGDSGSLAVGALVAGLFIAKGWWLFLGLCAFIWVVEVASVMIQVSAYKMTRKRVFLMSPLHHHFELAGWDERTIVFVFTGIQLLGCVVAFTWLRLGTAFGLAGTTLLVAIMGLLLLQYHSKKNSGEIPPEQGES